MDDIWIVTDAQATIRAFNQAALDVSRYLPEELLDKPLSMLFPDQSPGEARLRKKGGEVQPVRLSAGTLLNGGGQVFRAVAAESASPGLNRDQLLQSGKMAALGQLASSVAHEINNPLGGIMGIVDVLLTETPEDHQWREDFKMIKRASLQCQSIVKNLLEFSRAQKFQLSSVCVSDAVEASLRLAQHRLKLSKIELVRKYASGLPRLELSSPHIEQVFLNLILNAADAMPSGGTLTVDMDIHESAELRVMISDTGMGIRKEIMEWIFEPFFTTKGPGKGTGLGLPLCQNFLKQHGGRLEVRSEGEGRGATFTVVLPLKSAEAKK